MSKETENGKVVMDEICWEEFAQYHYGPGQIGADKACWRGEMGTSRVGGSKHKENIHTILSGNGRDDGDDLG